MRRFAVIDMGTNTFHLLIAGWRSEHDYVPIYRERIHVKLGEDGLELISPRKMKQAVDAMERFHQVIQLYEVHEVRAVATEGVRRASNGNILLQRIARGFDINPVVISGEEEAHLIYKGVLTTGLLREERAPVLLMDIGGGSVEFVLADQHGIHDIVSLPVGLATLTHYEEPDLVDDGTWRDRLSIYIDDGLAPISQIDGIEHVQTLVGSSGTFDVLSEAIGEEVADVNGTRIELDAWHTFISRILSMSKADRISDPAIPPNRVDLIAHALLLIDRVIARLPQLSYIKSSPFALKEGVLAEMMAAYSLIEN